MKLNHIIYSVVVAMSFMFILSCKEKEVAWEDLPMEEKVSGSYKLVSMDLKEPVLGYDYHKEKDTIYTTYWNMLEDCDKDNLMNFYSDFRWEVTEGPTYCGSEPGYPTTSNWEFDFSKEWILVHGWHKWHIIKLEEEEVIIMTEYSSRWGYMIESGILQVIWRKE